MQLLSQGACSHPENGPSEWMGWHTGHGQENVGCTGKCDSWRLHPGFYSVHLFLQHPVQSVHMARSLNAAFPPPSDLNTDELFFSCLYTHCLPTQSHDVFSWLFISDIVSAYLSSLLHYIAISKLLSPKNLCAEDIRLPKYTLKFINAKWEWKSNFKIGSRHFNSI